MKGKIGSIIIWISIALLSFIFIRILYEGFQANGVNKMNDAFNNTTALENMYYLVQITAGFAMSISVMVAVFQYVLTAHSERVKINNEKIERAINLAEYYKDNILDNIIAMRYVFKDSGAKNVLDHIKIADMVNFDSTELDEILSQADIKEIQNIMQSDKMYESIKRANEIYKLELLNFQNIEDTADLGSSQSQDSQKETAKKYMSNIVNDILNDMEYFSMNFTHKIADESVVFQSLHQTYVEAVQLLYYNIAINNQPNGKQFYTNVIKLYRMWYKTSKKRQDKITHGGRSTRHGNSARGI